MSYRKSETKMLASSHKHFQFYYPLSFTNQLSILLILLFEFNSIVYASQDVSAAPETKPQHESPNVHGIEESVPSQIYMPPEPMESLTLGETNSEHNDLGQGENYMQSNPGKSSVAISPEPIDPERKVAYNQYGELVAASQMQQPMQAQFPPGYMWPEGSVGGQPSIPGILGKEGNPGKGQIYPPMMAQYPPGYVAYPPLQGGQYNPYQMANPWMNPYNPYYNPYATIAGVPKGQRSSKGEKKNNNQGKDPSFQSRNTNGGEESVEEEEVQESPRSVRARQSSKQLQKIQYYHHDQDEQMMEDMKGRNVRTYNLPSRDENKRIRVYELPPQEMQVTDPELIKQLQSDDDASGISVGDKFFDTLNSKLNSEELLDEDTFHLIRESEKKELSKSTEATSMEDYPEMPEINIKDPLKENKNKYKAKKDKQEIKLEHDNDKEKIHAEIYRKKPAFILRARLASLPHKSEGSEKSWWRMPRPSWCNEVIYERRECKGKEKKEKRWSFSSMDGRCYLYEDYCAVTRKNTFVSLEKCMKTCWRPIE